MRDRLYLALPHDHKRGRFNEADTVFSLVTLVEEWPEPKSWRCSTGGETPPKVGILSKTPPSFLSFVNENQAALVFFD